MLALCRHTQQAQVGFVAATYAWNLVPSKWSIYFPTVTKVDIIPTFCLILLIFFVLVRLFLLFSPLLSDNTTKTRNTWPEHNFFLIFISFLVGQWWIIKLVERKIIHKIEMICPNSEILITIIKLALFLEKPCNFSDKQNLT